MKQFIYIFFFMLFSNVVFGQICDDIPGQQLDNDVFEAYPLGDFPSTTNSKWELWSANSARGEIYIPPQNFGKELRIRDNNGTRPDLLYLLGNRTTGRYRLSWSMKIETTAYYHIQHGDNGNSPNRAARIYFEPNRSGMLYLGSRTIINSSPNATFTYTDDNVIEHIIDLDQNRAELRVNGSLVHTWAFSEGETSNNITLGAINFFARSGNDYSIDNICFKRLDATGGNDSCEDCGSCFTYTPDKVEPQLVAFKSNFCGDDAVRWSFRRQNGATANVTFVEGSRTSLNPKCRFPGPGIYEVCFTDVRPDRLTARTQQLVDFDCCVWVVIPEVPCQEEAPPVCFFNYRIGTEPASFNFDATSLPTGNQFNWSFEDEDGNSVEPLRTRGDDRNPTYSFANLGSGCYIACLYVSNSCGMSKFCVKVCVNTSGCAPIPQLVQRVEPTVSGDQASFSQVPNIAGATYNWTVPEGVSFVGSSATSRAPTCRFPGTGFYVVCVEIKIGCHSICYCWTVSIGSRQSGEAVIFDCEDDVCGPPNTVVSVPIRVRNFEDILTFEYEIFVNNPNTARIIGISSPNLLSFSVGNVNLLPNGRLRVSWDDPTAVGHSVPDNTRIFSLDVELRGQPDQSTAINFTSANGTISGFVPIEVQTIQGSVCVEENMASITGRIYTEDNENIALANVQLAGAKTETITTNNTGNYSFTDLETNRNYTVTPRKNTSFRNGVSTVDVGRIRAHFLSRTLLDSPYKIIAGDINRDGRVNTQDVALARAIFLATPIGIDLGDSWRFIPADFQLPSDPFTTTFPENLIFSPLMSDQINEDFIGVKLGDVDNSANPNVFAEADNKIANSRNSQATVSIQLEDKSITEGGDTQFDIEVSGFSNILLLQFTLEWDASILSYEGTDNLNLSGLSTGNFGTAKVEEGQLILSWDNPTGQGITVDDNTTIFSVNFKAIGNLGDSTTLNLSDIILTDPSFINVEANSNIGSIKIENSVSFDNKILTQNFSISPNPSKTGIFNWRIGQQLNEKLELSVYNSVGKLILKENLQDSSPNSGIVNLTNYPKGVYFFTLRGVHTTISKKLIIHD